MEFSDEQKLFIVRALACFRTPKQVAGLVKEEYGLEEEPDRGHIGRYDPTKMAGEDLSEKWRTVFTETRTAFLDETAKSNIALRPWRIQALEDIYARATRAKNDVLAKEALRQAAEEMGNVYTNTRSLDARVGVGTVDELLRLKDELKQTRNDSEPAPR